MRLDHVLFGFGDGAGHDHQAISYGLKMPVTEALVGDVRCLLFPTDQECQLYVGWLHGPYTATAVAAAAAAAPAAAAASCIVVVHRDSLLPNLMLRGSEMVNNIWVSQLL